MSINNRLRYVMENKSLNIKTFAELLNMPYRTLQNYLLDERTPSADILTKIGSVLNVDLNWLMCGKGEIFYSSVDENKLTEKEKILINRYRMMSGDV
ncbi:MAG: helix-turn-helix domain-containing protein [Neisseriaceae bacterium]|nr:MAG: helix-turn-helix domain-containing protein [Neisseriaceae bacterium]